MAISTICEQGDLGLWQNELSPKDQKAYNEAVARENNENRNTQVINEEKKDK